MADDNYLVDAQSGEQRFRLRRMLATGRSYQIVLAEDTASNGRLVCAKADLYDADRLDDRDYVAGRHEALESEWQFLQHLDSDLLPEPVAFFRASNAEADFEDEPVLVYEYIEGKTLFEWVEAEHDEGLAPEAALGILRDLVQFLISVHAAGYIYRDLDPRHLIVDDEGTLCGVVGFGNVAEKGERPNVAKMEYADAPYVAPEARAERSGKMLRPAADAYALGALMSFMLTGEEPRKVVENPLNWESYDRLSNLEPPGLALLVARLIQPLAKKRFGRLERLQPFLTMEGLPTTKTKGFGMMLLPAPFSGVEDPEKNRALKSKLSSGPLISVEDEAPAGRPHGEAAMDDDGMPRSWLIGAVIMALVTVAVLISMGVI
jgi:serine/threonine protein kinase